MKQTWWTIRNERGEACENILTHEQDEAWNEIVCYYSEAEDDFVAKKAIELKPFGYTAVPIEIEVSEANAAKHEVEEK